MFEPGDTVVFEPKNFNQDYWNNLSEDDKIKYYGSLGYGKDQPVFFTFLCYHRPQSGHCVLVNMDNQQVETMRHPQDFRLVTDDEC